MIRITAEESNQNNTISVESIRKGYFLYFEIIRYNSFERFKRKNKNNNLLLLLEFEGKLKGGFNLLLEGNLGEFNPLLERNLGGFNPLSKENLGGLDSNITALVNTLIEVNLKINYIE